jgi:hypothetical protein
MGERVTYYITAKTKGQTSDWQRARPLQDHDPAQAPYDPAYYSEKLDDWLERYGTFLGEDYFERLLEDIREIRLSERKFYQKITDVYATSVDYNKDAPTTSAFFAAVQNKLHFAIHGHSAAELIMARADSDKAHMGLTTWERAPDGKIVKTDIGIAKKYLAKEELESLGRIVNAWLDLAEERARRKIPMTMEDWAKRLDDFLSFTDLKILRDSGKVSMEMAKHHAESEFEKYRIMQDRLFESDFDKSVKSLMEGKKKKE